MQRVDLLWAGIQRRQKHTLGSVVAAMNGASTQDLRVMRVWPVIRAVLARGTAPTPRASAAATQLDAWVAAGGSRIDDDLDGKIDAAGAAVMDAAWNRLADAVLAPVLGTGPAPGGLLDELARIVCARPAARCRWLELLRRLVVVRGQGPEKPARPPGAGRLRNAVLRGRQRRRVRSVALGGARRRVGPARGGAGASPAAWRADATKDRIGFAPGILTQTMRGSNKPTFQQAITFATHR